MILHWAVLALLLSVSALDEEPKIGEYKVRTLADAATEHNCPEGRCTLVQYSVRLCTKHVKLDDARLLLTSASLLRVDETGRILEIYMNDIASNWTRLYIGQLGGPFEGYIFDEKFVGNLAEAQEKASKITDIILYMGSDHADSYDLSSYELDSEFLHLKNGPKLDNVYTNGPFYPCMIWNNIYGKYDNIVFTNGKSETDNSEPSEWISSPGIYRFNIASRIMNQLYYDPNRPGNSYLT